MAEKFEIYPRADGDHGYRYKGGNGEIMFAAEGFVTPGNARRAIKRVKDTVRDAPIVVVKGLVDLPKGAGKIKRAVPLVVEVSDLEASLVLSNAMLQVGEAVARLQPPPQLTARRASSWKAGVQAAVDALHEALKVPGE